ncbi:linker histone H1 and H5 family protein, partial [Opisthorchis viverrini]
MCDFENNLERFYQQHMLDPGPPKDKEMFVLDRGLLVFVCGKRLTRGTSAPASAPTVLKKPKSAKTKIPGNHPPGIDMVKASTNAAKDRKGTSLPTIKKFIAANYKVDVEKLGPHIRHGIAHAVQKAVLVRIGNQSKDASGSVKVAEEKTAVAKPKPVKKPEVLKAKKLAAPKKPKAAKKPAKPKTNTPSKPKAAKKPMTSLATRKNRLSYVSSFFTLW